MNPSFRLDLDIKRGFTPWVFALVGVGFLGYIFIEDGFDIVLLLFMFGLFVFLLVMMEVAFWIRNFVIFHDDRVDISLLDWGGEGGTRERLPYEKIIDINHDEQRGEISIRFVKKSFFNRRQVERGITLRPKDPYRVMDELRWRVEAVKPEAGV